MIASALLILSLSAANAPQVDCANAMTQMDMNICSFRDYRTADQQLNDQWKITSAKMRAQDQASADQKDGRPGYYETLLAAQRAWIKFRDLHCRNAGYAMRGGSAEPLLINLCLTSLTEIRLAQLKDLAEEN